MIRTSHGDYPYARPMNLDSVIANLEAEWALESGFLGRIRGGNFDAELLDRLVRVLEGIDAHPDTEMNRRLVSLLWYMPLFMHWNGERIQSAGGDLIEFDKAANRIESAVERILGVP